MKEYTCSVCGFIYNKETAQRSVEGNIITFEDISGDWACPNCGVSPDMFVPSIEEMFPEEKKEK